MAEPRTLFTVGPREGGKRLDRFLKERIPGQSRTRIQEAIRARVSLSWGVAARPSTPVIPGGEVRIAYVPPAETLLEIPIRVLGRGAGWLAVDKPPGIPVHPCGKVCENSLIRLVRRRLGRENLRLAHRLDRETSGVLLVAEDPRTSRAISTAFEQGRVHKEYLALVEGEVDDERGVIDLPIGPAAGSRVHVRLRTRPDGKPAETAWRRERRVGGRTLLRVFPRSGRRHQIRVHLAAIGHPVVGDVLYGTDDDGYLEFVRGIRRRAPARHLLHCAKLRFPDPGGGATVEVRSPLPDDFLAWTGGVRPAEERVAVP